MIQILLDTNTLSLYFKHDPKILEVVENADYIYVSVITIGELVYGFMKGSSFEKNRLLLERFLNNPLVKLIKVGRKTAIVYGEIYSILSKRGVPIPTNDVWIAACAIETDSSLVTYDKHFLKIPDVKLWNELKRTS